MWGPKPGLNPNKQDSARGEREQGRGEAYTSVCSSIRGAPRVVAFVGCWFDLCAFYFLLLVAATC